VDLSRLQGLRADMEKCFRCSLCKMVPLPTVRHPSFTDACPAAREYHFHGYSGSGKQIMALSLLDHRIQPDEALARITFACTACGYCDVACKFIMDAERQRVNMALREYLAAAGLAPAAHQQIAANLRAYGHAEGKPRRAAGAWAEGLGLKVLPQQKAQTLLLAGCGPRNDENSARTAKRFARLLREAGVDIGILGDAEPCCGLPAYWSGYGELFAETAARNSALFAGLGIKTMVVASGSCLGAFRSKYPEYAAPLGVEAVHATELLMNLIEQGRLILTRPVTARATYHDPCYLGRQSEPYPKWEGEEKTALGVMTYYEPPKPINRGSKGVYEAPRKILRAIPGLEFIEMHRVREYSFCCGGGGGAPAAFPALARSAALHRLNEACAVKAELLVTACAHCERQFRSSQADPESLEHSEAGPGLKMPVVDIIDLVFEAAGLKE